MLSFTRKTDYALVALAYLAENDPAGNAPLSARQLADVLGIPAGLLMNLMKDLHRAGLVRSKRGVDGGYCLAGPAESISLVDVIEAIEGPVRMALCCDAGGGDDCMLVSRCPITQSIRRLNLRVLNLLGRVTLADLVTSSRERKLADSPGEGRVSPTQGARGLPLAAR